MEYMSKAEIIRRIIDDVESELNDEELLHLVLERTVTERHETDEKTTLGQRAADRLARFAGSWTFVLGFSAFIFIWIVVNAVVLLTRAFDPYPFILLNLLLSCLAAIQAPLIMMSQNRQEEKDRRRAQNDYKVNLKTEVIIRDIHDKLDDMHVLLRRLELTADDEPRDVTKS